jgi:hypothetical protein
LFYRVVTKVALSKCYIGVSVIRWLHTCLYTLLLLFAQVNGGGPGLFAFATLFAAVICRYSEVACSLPFNALKLTWFGPSLSINNVNLSLLALQPIKPE